MASKLYGVAKVRNTTKNAWCLQWNMVVAVSLCGAAWVLLVSGSCISLMASWIHKCTALYWKRRCYHHSVPLVVVQHDNDPMVQNAAARLLTGAKKHDHITPILASLQLPVSFRIQFKILLIVLRHLMDKPHLTFRILSHLNLLLSPSDLLIKLFYMSHGHDLSLKVTEPLQ